MAIVAVCRGWFFFSLSTPLREPCDNRTKLANHLGDRLVDLFFFLPPFPFYATLACGGWRLKSLERTTVPRQLLAAISATVCNDDNYHLAAMKVKQSD